MSDALGQNKEPVLDAERARAENVTEVFESNTSGNAPLKTSERPAPLFPGADAQGFRSRWDAVQTAFVDEPRKSVEEADNLVESVIKRLSEIFGDERAKLESQWESGDNVSTEDLRLALQRYRSFFTRLLSV